MQLFLYWFALAFNRPPCHSNSNNARVFWCLFALYDDWYVMQTHAGTTSWWDEMTSDLPDSGFQTPPPTVCAASLIPNKDICSSIFPTPTTACLKTESWIHVQALQCSPFFSSLNVSSRRLPPPRHSVGEIRS